MLVLAGGLFFLPAKDNTKGFDPGKLMYEAVQNTRFVSTDDVARMIIEKDPTLQLVDVRSADEYMDYTLNNALNIPIDSLITESYQDYFDIEGINMVFFSNDDIKADQAWVLARRMGHKNLYVMKGGLNHWMNTIIKPPYPGETCSKEAFEIYNFRRGASIFFTGAALEQATDRSKADVKIIRKKKKSAIAGGC